MAKALINVIYGSVETMPVSAVIKKFAKSVFRLEKRGSQCTRIAAKNRLPARFPKKTFQQHQLA